MPAQAAGRRLRQGGTGATLLQGYCILSVGAAACCVLCSVQVSSTAAQHVGLGSGRAGCTKASLWQLFHRRRPSAHHSTSRTPPPLSHQVYAELRRESSVTHGMPIAVRHLESMIRMSEARAAMHLREYVNDDDIDCAIR